MRIPAAILVWTVLFLCASLSAAPADASKTHWAYVKPVRPELPKVKHSHWPRNPIDIFILARLEKEKLKPAPEADRATLIRRLSLDLTGLPPTIAEVDAFVGDKSKDAYEKVVNRLLASPHYGEKWARHWLDLARYADTHGYEKDPRRSMWPYRDWVINAFNRGSCLSMNSPSSKLPATCCPTPRRTKTSPAGSIGIP